MTTQEEKKLSQPSKKEQIESLYVAGIHNIGELASLTHSRPSYVASVLKEARMLKGYFDLYTTTEDPMNIYSGLFAKRLGFRTVNIARRSVQYIDRLYHYFESMNDRAGQHHALMMALTMFNRARWSQKLPQAKVFKDWIVSRLDVADVLREHQALERSPWSQRERVRH
jgi:hypothetical protein